LSDEEQAVAEISPAPEQEATAAPESVEMTPEEQQSTKSFSQEELDAIVGKRLAREQRKWERDQAQRFAEQQARQPAAPPPAPDDFDNAPAYAEALAHQILAQKEAAKQQAALFETYKDREEEARDRYEDFEQVAYNPNLPVTDFMAQAIQASDIGPEVIYHLGSNPKEAKRIADLPPLLQAKEIGKIEAKLVADPPTKRTSTAPAPLAPVTATRSSSGPRYDTTDPRSLKSMSTSDWIEAERLRQIKKWEAQNRR
jgi:hypothetical protein